MKARIRDRFLSGKDTQEAWSWEAPHASLARRAAEDGIVLLKNEGVLPLTEGSAVALYGAGASRTVKGGTGSGDVNERHSVSIAEGMRAAGFRLTTEEWLADYERRYTEARLAWRDEIYRRYFRLKEPRNMFDAYSAVPFMAPAGGAAAATGTDTAVFVISRVAGEAADRAPGAGDYLLSAAEKEQLRDVCSLYARVIVIINAGGVMDLSFMDEYEQIRALLIVSQPGMEGGHAVASVLKGEVSPSGHLTDSWPYHYEDIPGSGAYSKLGGDLKHAYYTEGIYVGYRYFDSFEVPVRYGFGDGLSYTGFTLQLTEGGADESGTVRLRVRAVNTGSRAGKAVVQVYASLPYGRLEKEARRLVAFGKTGLLAPGAAEELALTFEAEELASFDEQTTAWVLEPGVYGLAIGESLQGSRMAAALRLERELCLRRTEHICPLKQELKELRRDPAAAAQRYEAVKKEAEGLPVWQLPMLREQTTAVKENREARTLAESLTDEQLIRLVTGDPSHNQGSMLGAAGMSVPGSAGETSDCAETQGIAGIVLADGPAGLRLTQKYYVRDGRPLPMPIEASMENGFLYMGEQPKAESRYQYCTAFPVGTMLAQTWNPELVSACGKAVGEEMLAYGITLWLAPGMNIHRNPLCGRNFEYYSEDPLLSGLMAAAMTEGVQQVRGCGTTIKHYACNNQEENRMGADSVVSERALREIYLRGFGITIRKARPMAMMTSYNLVNGIHSANSHDLCTKAARQEFGFDGVIMTDWTTTNQHDPGCTAAGCIRAGNDLVMPGAPEDHENLRAALADGTLTRKEMEIAAAHLIGAVLRSDRYEA